MNSNRFYPYQTATDQIALELSTPPGALYRRSGDDLVIAYEDETDSVSLNVAVCVADGVLNQVVAPAEREDPPVDIRLVYKSYESRKRCAMSLSGDGVYEGELTLERREWLGSVEVRALLVRTRRNRDLPPGFATELGSLLAWSEPKRVLLDEPRHPPGNRLEVRWENFAEQGNAWRKRHASSIFALDIEGERPVVILNSGVPRAVDVLGSAGTHGKKARIRDAVFYQIAHQVWSSLIAIALTRAGSIRRSSPEASVEDVLQELEEWEKRVLRDWSAYLYPNQQAGSALEALLEAGGDPTATQEVMTLLPNAIQQRFGTPRGFGGLVEEGDRL